MTNQKFPIGSIEWLNAMRTDFNLNAGRTRPEPVVFIQPERSMAEIHSEIGDMSNRAAALREMAVELEGRVVDLSARLDQIKRT